MDALLERKLTEIYPEFFSRLRGRRLSCTIGNGWYPLLASLVTELHALSLTTGEQFLAEKIEADHGALRIHIDSSRDSDALNLGSLLAKAAEHYSEKICEICGRAAETVEIGGQFKALCGTHDSEYREAANIEYSIEELMQMDRPKLDLSHFPLIGLIEKSIAQNSEGFLLTLVRYRSMVSYALARLKDIEIRCEVGLFVTPWEAGFAADEMCCDLISFRL